MFPKSHTTTKPDTLTEFMPYLQAGRDTAKSNHFLDEYSFYRDIGPAVRVFANGPGSSHTKDFKNGTWYHLA